MSRRSPSAFFSLLIVALTLAVGAAASPAPVQVPNLVSLPMAKRLNLTGTSTLLAHDQARVRNLRARANAQSSGLSLSANAIGKIDAENELVDYVVRVQVGDPSTVFNLLVDTGSSNTWVGAGTPFVKSRSTQATKDAVSVVYGSGEFSGAWKQFLDRIDLGSGLIVNGQSIGVADQSQGFEGVDGVLGIGPSGLTIGSLSPDTKTAIPTVTDNLFAQGKLSANQVSVSFQPTNQDNNFNGELAFGGIDNSKFIGNINFAPITGKAPASGFFGIDASIRYGANTNILNPTSGIIDTGTTLVLIADDALQRYQAATGAVFDDVVGLLRITPDQFQNLESLFFHINGVHFEFTANAQIWPRNLNSAIGGDPNSVFLIVGSAGTNSGSGLDFINGLTFLERFYAVLDTGKKQVGLANTRFTQANTN
ncbi:acid protease [Trametes elegans]|nr:acid protease [Trametes elegans]